MSERPVFRAPVLELAGIGHGFFGRCGDLSTGIYASRNAPPDTAERSDDAAKCVATNRARIADTMAVSAANLVGLHQIHSAKAVLADAPWQDGPPKADAVVSKTPGLALSIITADCAPILLADAKAGIIGAAHAGWRGAKAGIIEQAVKTMVALGAEAKNIHAAIGPCIAQQSYEVGPEFVDEFTKCDTSHSRFFVRGGDDRWQFDLKGFCAHQLHRAGVGKVETLPHDTCAQENEFFSYRRATLRGESDYGRNISVILVQQGAEDGH